MPTLHWIGKEKVINHHRDVPFHVLNEKYAFNTEGAIFISIDDNEQANLKLVCDEVFGKSKFI